MWVFTRHGFFSAVQHFENPNLIHVRARFQGDLERLCQMYSVHADIQHTPGNDYPFRMDFDRGTWSQIMASEANAIDYENFKSAVHDGTARDTAYMRCWTALRSAQNET